MYLFIMTIIGHLKIDILYIIFIFMVSGLAIGLFFLAKLIFKKSAKDAIDSIIKNPGELINNAISKNPISKNPISKNPISLKETK